jgi:amino acid adenylation domain-containing protein/non-ribosomal peptide synthase protein (TIGR01720 family)
MLSHFRQVLLSMIAPDAVLGTLSLLSIAETSLMLRRGRPLQDVEAGHVLELFASQVKAHPGAAALDEGGLQTSYEELDSWSAELGSLLQQQGVEPGALIGLCVPRCSAMIAGILGILKSGGAYVPLDPGYPRERLAFLVRDAGMRIIVTHVDSQGLFDELGAVEQVRFGDFVICHLPTVVVQSIPSADTAYVIYTSGSTGVPKGVLISHKNLYASTLSRVQYYGNPGRYLLVPSYSFDSSVAVIFGSLCAGGCLLISSESQIRDAAYVKELLLSTDTLLCVPSYYRFLLTEGLLSGSRLSVVILAGEHFEEGLVSQHYDILPTSALYNEYGPTECTVWSTVSRLSAGSPVSIGSALPTVGIYVLDSEGGLLPAGVSGEICISGPQVSTGYLNREELSGSRFIADPYHPGQRMYLSGDMGYWSYDGTLVYQGRRDDQVKIRGYRIELSEIGRVMEGAAGVARAVALVREEGGVKQLCGFVVGEEEIDTAALKAHLHHHLPEYMIPSVLQQVEYIPLTYNGKTDKEALLSMLSAAGNATGEDAGLSPAAQELADIWSDLLGVERVGADDNFFELGGDSIIAIQVVSRFRRRGYQLDLQQLFTYQTIGRLSAILSSGEQQEAAEAITPLSGAVGLLPVQRWYFDQVHVDGESYNQSVLVGISKSVTAEQLSSALHQLQQRHDALRFCYRRQGDVWEQSYGDYYSRLEVEQVSDSDQITALSSRYQQSLDLEKGDVFRMVLMQTGEDIEDNHLLVVAHHLCIDGVSWRILLEDLSLLLQGQQLSPRLSSYRDWYEGLQRYATTAGLQQQAAYWSGISKAYSPLPAAAYSGPLHAGDMHHYTGRLEAELTRQLLQEAPKAYHTEINDLLLSALLLTISEWSGRDEVVIGMEGHGREDRISGVDSTQTVGWFTSLYPVLLSLDEGNRSADAVIRHVKENLRRIPDKGIGYGVLKYLRTDSALPVEDPWDISFNYLGQVDNVVGKESFFTGVPESSGEPRGAGIRQREILSLNSVVAGGELNLEWGYSSRHFDEEHIKQLTGRYLHHLKTCILHCVDCNQRGVSHHTPSDYGLSAEVDYKELDRFLNNNNSLDEILSF